MNKKLMILIGVGLVCGGAGWFYLAQGQKAQTEVKVVKPFYGSMERSVAVTGIVQPQNRLEIKPPIPGRVEQIYVEEGQRVKVGDVLALMSSTERAALLDAARLQGGDTLKDWEEVYKPTPLLAPIDGHVIVKAVYPGQTVTSSDAVIVLSDRLIVQAQVDETDIGKVKVAQAAVISLDAYPDIQVNGQVDHVYYESTTVNNVTIYKVDILPEKVPEEFRSGMSANVRIVQEKKDGVLLVPLAVVQYDKEQSYVMAGQGKGNKPLRRDIRTGLADDTNVEITAGLSAEDRIVQTSTLSGASKGKRSGATNPFMPSGPRRAR